MAGGYPVLMFLALMALFSPLAALSAYMPVVGRFSPADQTRLALGLLVNTAVFALAAVWIGEPLLKFLGIPTAALTVTGGVALFYAGVPMMQGNDMPAEAGEESADGSAGEGESWRQVLFTPLTFPLTVGGTSFGIIVAFTANAGNLFERVWYSLAGLAYAVLASGTLFVAAHLNRRISARARSVLARVAGILLTAIAAALLADGGTRLVVATLEALGR